MIKYNFELEGDVLKKITIETYTVHFAILPDKKLRVEIGKEMSFDEKRSR